jgi:predicted nuclease with TOPRIM domain
MTKEDLKELNKTLSSLASAVHTLTNYQLANRMYNLEKKIDSLEKEIIE